MNQSQLRTRQADTLHIPCGSEPARENDGTFNTSIGCDDPFASRLAPTRTAHPRNNRHYKKTVTTCLNQPF